MGAVKDGAWLNLEKEITHWTMDMGKERSQNQRYWPSNCLKYHFDWNWIMPVLTKIEKFYEVSIIGQGNDFECDVAQTGYHHIGKAFGMATTKEKAVHNAIINFINRNVDL